MSEELTKLYNTMMLVETKGESTKIMGNCLQYLDNLIAKARSEENSSEEQIENVSEEE